MSCPLCLIYNEPTKVMGPFDQRFFHCPNCNLVYRSRNDLVNKADERARYLTHNNSIENEGYVNFLLKAYDLARHHIEKDQRMLDYGCGYVPVFTQLMHKKGNQCDHYDPLFFEEGIRQPKYPVIFCIETAEHFHHPSTDWERMDELLDENGILTVMTDLWTDRSTFPEWHYMRDETHTSFYHFSTLEWIAKEYNWRILDTDRERIVVFQK